MDNVYDNLDNYNEENTIAELREENDSLKRRLEEYADKLDKLQREFDMLTSEHKKLEINYSSLLKTARSEIERKTQIITKLNIEKDAMVLNSIQNRNTFNNRRRTPIEKPIKNQEEARISNSDQTQFIGDNSVRSSYPSQGPKERREDNSNPSSNTSTPRNIQTRLLNIVNNTGNPNLKGAKQNVAKENNKLNNDSETTRARITSRRKSMPVFSVENFSSDEDELINTGSSKEFVTKEQSERHLDPKIDKRNMEEKISGHKSSTETRSRHGQYDSEKYRSRDRHEPFLKHKRHYSPDQNRKRSHDRRKGSPDKRRGSPKRNTRETHDHIEEFYKRQEYDRRRRLVSPSKDKYCHDFKQRNRHSPRSSERNYSQQDRYKSRDQDMHAMKHKLLPDYEQSSKRMRLDSIPKHDEERSRIERQVGHIPLDLDYMHSMTCQSPDQTHFEGHQYHQTREIKLNASAKLDDPRLLSQKYALKTHDGKTELCTVESANIDVKMIDTSNWEMTKTVKIPDALLKKPMTLDMPGGLLQKRLAAATPEASFQKQNSPDSMSVAEIQKLSSSNVFINAATTDILETALQKQKFAYSSKIPDTPMEKQCFYDDHSSISSTQRRMSTDVPDILIQKSSEEISPVALAEKSMSTDDPFKEIYMDIENPISNISLELGEIYNFQNDFHGPEEDTNELNTRENTQKHATEPQKIENNHQRSSNYKKSKIIREDTLNAKILHNDDQKPNPKLKNTKNMNDSNKATDDSVDKMHYEIQKSKLPEVCRSNVPCEYRDFVSTKEMIEGDLELSDENSDNNDVQIIKQTPVSDNKQDSATKDLNLTSNKTPTFKSINQLKFDFDEPSTRNIEEQNLKTKHIEATFLDTRKPKARKRSLKLKETREPHINKESAECMPVNKNENTRNEPFENTNTSLSMEQLVTIKESITKELSKELTLSVEKAVKKKDQKDKSKLQSKNKDAALTNDKPIPKKDKHSKDLSENKDTLLTGKPVKKKDNNPKQQHNKKESAVVDKSLKKKENKTKESLEPKNTIPLEKPTKRKKNRVMESSENPERATEKLDKTNEPKTKESKFNELFGDSSSLVSPEDLGLVPTVVPQENYVALCEDALDATDVSAGILPTEKSNDIFRKDPTTSKFGLGVKNIATPAIVVEPNTEKLVHMVTKPVESTINQTIYQNLQPQISPKDNEIVKTVIISSGTQPQRVLDATTKYPFENDRTDADLHVMQCVKPTVIQDIALQALASSTPQKVWQQNVVQPKIDQKLTNTGCSNESQEGSINKTPVIVHSDTTNHSETNNRDEPDMTIFVKRRRKIAKKK